MFLGTETSLFIIHYQDFLLLSVHSTNQNKHQFYKCDASLKNRLYEYRILSLHYQDNYSFLHLLFLNKIYSFVE